MTGVKHIKTSQAQKINTTVIKENRNHSIKGNVDVLENRPISFPAELNEKIDTFLAFAL